jgi:hypothetical protein
MTKNKGTIKSHIAAGLDITAPVTWVNHLGQEVPAKVERQGRFWIVRTVDGSKAGERGDVLQSGGHGARFTFVY